MRAKLINEVPERTYALVMETGDDVVAELEAFAREHELIASRITAIGAFSRVTLGYFDWQKKAYERIEVDEQVEVLSLWRSRTDRPSCMRTWCSAGATPARSAATCSRPRCGRRSRCC